MSKIDWFNTEKLQNTITDLEVEIANLKKEIEVKDSEIGKLVENINLLKEENGILVEENSNVDFCYNGNSYNLGGYWDR